MPITRMAYKRMKQSENYSFSASACKDELLDRIAKKVFEAVGAKHYLRIDFRMSNQVPYVIGIKYDSRTFSNDIWLSA